MGAYIWLRNGRGKMKAKKKKKKQQHEEIEEGRARYIIDFCDCNGWYNRIYLWNQLYDECL